MSISHISEVLPAVVPLHVGRRSFQELVEEFEANESLENPDAVVPLKKLWFLNEGTLAIPGLQGPFAFTDWSKRQLAALVGVRWDRWFARMSPEDQAAEVNKRLWSSEESLRVRTSRVAVSGNGVAGIVRALVSPTFSPLPDSQLLGLLKEALEPVESELRVIRSAVTDRSATYVIGVGRTFRPGDDHEVGDLWGGLCIRNSGVGFAAAMIVASFTRLICKNGTTAPIPDALLFHRAHHAFDLKKVRETLVERFRELPGWLPARWRRSSRSAQWRRRPGPNTPR